MSLKSFIAQIEAQQLNEFAGQPTTGTAPSTSTSTAPTAAGQQQAKPPAQKVLVKPGQPQQTQPGQPAPAGQPPATITDQSGKIIAQADPMNAKKLGDMVNAGNITMMNPQTGEPLQEDGTQELQLDEALVRIKENHPYEHKQFLEGWGMDSGLFEALAEHYFKEGKIPRTIWHGPLQELKEFVEECYAKDNGVGGNEAAINGGMLDEAPITTDHTGDMNSMSLEELYTKADEAEAQGNQVLAQQYFQAAEHKKTNMRQQSSQGQHLRVIDEFSLDSRQDNSIVDRLGATVEPEMDPGKQNSFNAPAVNRHANERGYNSTTQLNDKPNAEPNDKEIKEMSELEKRLKQPTEESTMYESKKLKGGQAKLDANKNGKLEKSDFEALRAKKVEEATEKTKTGLKHTADAGGYGRKHEDDEDEDGKKVKKDAPKKGRGRPKKDSDSETGEKKEYKFDALSAFGGGKKPKKEVGKLTTKHRIKTKADSDKVDESFSKWDAQLKSLLEGKQLKEGLSVSTSVGNEHTPDSVSITANDEDAHELLKLIQTAGLGLKKDPHSDLMTAHGDSSPFSAPADDEESAGDIEVVDFDDAQGGLEGEEDGMDAMKQMLAAMGIGKETAPEPKHPEFDSGSDSEEASDEEGSEEDEDSETDSDDEGSEEKEKVMGEEDMEEGNMFTGNLAKAREEGKKEADLDGDGDGDMEKVKEDDMEESEEKVEESAETQCNECGAMYEGDSHECSHSSDEQLNEWANTRGGSSEDEQFTTDMEFMMNVISGGINGKKKDQTVMPGTKVKVSEGYTIDVAAEMRKLAGIK